ncbi:MAG TPA: hypothetical protein VI112_05050 [Bacteroidia bacterium]|jgi:hypothetical protein
MKKLAFLFFCSTFASANASIHGGLFDTVPHTHKISFAISLLEEREVFPLQNPLLRGLGNGLGDYLYRRQAHAHLGMFKLGFYLRGKWGLEFGSDIDSIPLDPSFMKNYIASHYPDFFQPGGKLQHAYRLSGGFMRSCYRFRLHYFDIVPKAGIGLLKIGADSLEVSLKQNGSNQFVNYEVQPEAMHSTLAFDLALSFEKKIGRLYGQQMLLALSGSYTVCRPQLYFSVTESRYSGTSTSEFLVKDRLDSYSAMLSLVFRMDTW